MGASNTRAAMSSGGILVASIDGGAAGGGNEDGSGGGGIVDSNGALAIGSGSARTSSSLFAARDKAGAMKRHSKHPLYLLPTSRSRAKKPADPSFDIRVALGLLLWNDRVYSLWVPFAQKLGWPGRVMIVFSFSRNVFRASDHVKCFGLIKCSFRTNLSTVWVSTVGH